MNTIINIATPLICSLLSLSCTLSPSVDILVNSNAIAKFNDIVFTSYKGDKKFMYSMNSDGGDKKQLISGTNHEPSISPNGKYMAFSHELYEGEDISEIFIMNPDGSNIKQLTHHSSISNGAVWSPDSKSIAYYTWDNDNWEIFIISLEDGTIRNLTQDPLTQTYPSWSPDGKTIAFHQQEKDDDWNIYSINIDGSSKKQLTNNKAEDWIPSWSPNGEKISFWSTRNGNWQVFTMNKDGSNKKQVSKNILTHSTGICPARWSPDGLNLVVSVDMGANNSDIANLVVN